MFSVRVIAAAAVLGLVSACGQDGRIYAKSPEQMHAALERVDELPPVFGSAVPDLAMETADPSSVSWIVTLDGSELMRFVAKLEAADAQSTRMNLDLVGVRDGAMGDVEKRLAEHPEIERLYLVAMQEQIDSTLESRKYDASKLFGAVAAATAANIGTISRQSDAAAADAAPHDQLGESQ